MNRSIKSLAYAFIAHDINIYFPDGEENCFLIEKLECLDCGAFWHTSLLECFFCGELNYYLYTDITSGNFFSITNSSGSSNKIKACINPNCLSNTNPEIKHLTTANRGVFELNSSFNLSQNYCVKCGSAKNIYNSIKVFLFDDANTKSFEEFLKTTNIFKGDCIVFKKHKQDKINYGYLFYNGNLKKLPACDINDIHELINAIMSKSSNV